MPVAMNRRRVSNFTYVSPCVKYMIFLLNFLFWLFGGLLVAAGTFAFYEKWNTMGSIKLNTFSDVILNISLVLIIAGQIIFIVSFAGCIGALRENTTLLKFLPFKNIAAQNANVCVSNLNVSQTSNFNTKNTDSLKKSKPMNNDKIIFKLLDRYDVLLNIQAKAPIYTNSLKPMNDSQLNFYKKYVIIDRDQILNLMYSTMEQSNISAWRLHRQTRISYSLCLLIFFLLEMGIAIIGFVFPHNMQATLEESFTDKIIHTYRDDPDLQNLIDFAQKEFQCCGLSSEGYIDWSKNEYFNCSSPSVEKCGVPYSCCMNATDISKGLVNVMCGYGAQDSSVAEASKRVWTSGCIEVIRIWAERNLYTIAGVALGVALSQLLIINLAKTLEGQIDLQKSRWAS